MTCDLVLVPTCLYELKYFIKSRIDNYIVITDDLETILFCKSNAIKFYEFKDLIDLNLYKKIDVNSILDKFSKDILCKTQKKYFYIFKYNIGHFIRLVELSNLIFDGINNKITFKKIYCFSYGYKIPYSRSNLKGVLQLLLSLKFKNKLYKPSFSNFLLYILNFFMFLLNSCAEIFFLLEFVLNKIYKYKAIPDFNTINKDKILFFSGGRDFTFHSKLSKKLKGFYLANLKGNSIFDMSAKNDFNLLVNLQSLLLNGFFKREINNSFDKEFLNQILANSLNSKLLTNYFINYYTFRIKRDFKIINSLIYIINEISPKLIFSSSLSLPLVTSCHLKIKSVSEFEGFGIEQNPMAPYIGDYVFTPSNFCVDQFNQYESGNGIIIKNGAYYL